jgi:tRNA dimethylallyltransferase
MAGPVLLVGGPTASGKSELAWSVAQRRKAALVNADSLQLYAGLPIATAQGAGRVQLQGVVPPRLFASSPWFSRRARALLEAEEESVVVGGTNYYLEALLWPDNMASSCAASGGSNCEQPLEAYSRLQMLDPKAAAVVHPKDVRKTRRALELAVQRQQIDTHSLEGASMKLGDLNASHRVVFLIIDAPDECALQILSERIEKR